MSLPLSGVSYVVGLGTVSSPGLIQLAGMMNEYDEENMSLEALLKLLWAEAEARQVEARKKESKAYYLNYLKLYMLMMTYDYQLEIYLEDYRA
jgi:hypothetical protein